MDIRMDFRECRITKEELYQQVCVLRKLVVELDNAIGNLKEIDDNAIRMVVVKIEEKKESIWKNIRKLQTLLNALEQITYQYERTERKIEDFSGVYIMEAKFRYYELHDHILIRKLPLPGIHIISKYFN